jgi:hypothetical protein
VSFAPPRRALVFRPDLPTIERVVELTDDSFEK